MYNYKTKGVCAQYIGVELEEDKETIKEVKFMGGCAGNASAISRLVAGQKVDDVVRILEGNTCGRRNTSCADQMTIALREAQAAAQ